jgi:hypothetical protein
MTHDLANLVSSINRAQRRVQHTTPGTAGRLDAEREAICARANYWDAMRVAWDVEHPTVTDAAR